MKQTYRCRTDGGFTLVEMLAVMAISAVMLAIAAPNLTQLLESQRLRAMTFDLISDLTLARNESLKRSARVNVVPTTDRNWSGGWRVVVETSGEVVRQRSQAGGAVLVSDAPAVVTYDRSGRLAGTAGVIRMGLESMLLSGQAHGRCITIDPLGRSRSDVGTCS